MLDDFDAGVDAQGARSRSTAGTALRHTWTVTESVRRVLDAARRVPDAAARRRPRAARAARRAPRLCAASTPPTIEDEVEAARRPAALRGGVRPPGDLAQRRRAASGQATTPRPPRAGWPARGLRRAAALRAHRRAAGGRRDHRARRWRRDRPMHRLLQGEVGSGKTVVALRAMLAAVDAGGQAALLAPTEVLAAQHHRTITAMLGDLAEGGMLGGAEHRHPRRAAHRQPVDGRAAPDAARRRDRRRRHRRRHPRAAPGERRLLRPRPRGRRRAAPLRRRAAGCAARQGHACRRTCWS